eukprot:TRINITY_DN2776_c0_g1_i1.p1 TRINITY_DN2776_c0_g1~~TRINITY_DN2776_c0_g1_i1.p1  ORF type:complete len:1064 (+),score=115.14 TRINITY_DN2776_c0_g1_i1:853-4044(+)
MGNPPFITKMSLLKVSGSFAWRVVSHSLTLSFDKQVGAKSNVFIPYSMAVFNINEQSLLLQSVAVPSMNREARFSPNPMSIVSITGSMMQDYYNMHCVPLLVIPMQLLQRILFNNGNNINKNYTKFATNRKRCLTSEAFTLITQHLHSTKKEVSKKLILRHFASSLLEIQVPSFNDYLLVIVSSRTGRKSHRNFRPSESTPKIPPKETAEEEKAVRSIRTDNNIRKGPFESVRGSFVSQRVNPFSLFPTPDRSMEILPEQIPPVRVINDQHKEIDTGANAKLRELQEKIDEINIKCERRERLKEAETKILEEKFDDVLNKLLILEGKMNDKSEWEKFKKLIHEELSQKDSDMDQKLSKIKDFTEIHKAENEKRFSDLVGKYGEFEKRINAAEVTSRKYTEDKCQDLFTRTQKQFVSLQEEIKSGQDQLIEKMKEQQETAKLKVDAQEAKINELLKKNNELEKKLLTAGATNKKYIEEVAARLQKQISAFEDSLAEAQANVNTKLKEQEDAANSQIEAQNGKIASLESLIEENEKVRNKYNEEHKAITQGKIESITKRFDTLTEKLNGLSESINVVKSDQDQLLTRFKDALETRLTELDKTVKEREQETTQTSLKRFAEYENTQAQFQAELGELKARLKTARNDIEEATKKRVTEVEGKPQGTDRIPVKALAQSAVIGEEVQEHAIKIMKLEEELKKQAETHAKLEHRVKSLESSNADPTRFSLEIPSLKEDVKCLSRVVESLKTANGINESNWRANELRINEINMTLLNRTRELQSKISYLEDRFENYKIMASSDLLRYSQRRSLLASTNAEEDKAMSDFSLKPMMKESIIGARKQSPHYLREDARRSQDRKMLISVPGTRVEENISSRHFKSPDKFEMNMEEIQRLSEKNERLKTKYSDIVDFRGMDFEDYHGPSQFPHQQGYNFRKFYYLFSNLYIISSTTSQQWKELIHKSSKMNKRLSETATPQLIKDLFNEFLVKLGYFKTFEVFQQEGGSVTTDAVTCYTERTDPTYRFGQDVLLNVISLLQNVIALQQRGARQLLYTLEPFNPTKHTGKGYEQPKA